MTHFKYQQQMLMAQIPKSHFYHLSLTIALERAGFDPLQVLLGSREKIFQSQLKQRIRKQFKNGTTTAITTRRNSILTSRILSSITWTMISGQSQLRLLASSDRVLIMGLELFFSSDRVPKQASATSFSSGDQDKGKSILVEFLSSVDDQVIAKVYRE